MDNLTDKQRRFCEEYVIDWNATRAAIAAGYSEKTAGVIGSENLKKNYLRRYIEKIKPRAIDKMRAVHVSKLQSGSGNIYLIHCSGTNFYKIGFTRQTAESRLRSMQVGLPFDLTLVCHWRFDDVEVIERRLHDRYSGNGVRGEWFEFSRNELKAVLSFISRIAPQVYPHPDLFNQPNIAK